VLFERRLFHSQFALEDQKEGMAAFLEKRKARLQESIELVERIWLKSYPPGVPAEINPDEYKSLVELFETSIRKYGEAPGVQQHGQDRISFADLDRMSRDFGA